MHDQDSTLKKANTIHIFKITDHLKAGQIYDVSNDE